MSRVRSPNYPALSLPNAIEKARLLHKADGRNAISREAMVKAMGFGTLNGASATVLSAMAKYGLIEPSGEGEARITELAMRALFPHDENEEQAAIEEAAFKPALFAELREKWPERPPSDENLRSYLIRRGFTQSAMEQVIQFYRETLDIVGRGGSLQGPTVVQRSGDAPMPAYVASAPVTSPSAAVQDSKPFAISFDGSVLTGSLTLRTVRDIERLMRVLQAQKAAFEAMHDDEEDQTDIGSEMNDENHQA